MAQDLTQEEIEAAAKAEAEKKKPIEITDELFEAEMLKRMGGSSKDFIKKEEQIKVLTEDEKKAIQDQKYQDSLKVALEQNWVKRNDYEEYLKADATDRVQIAKEDYIKKHPELGDKAGDKFDKIYRVKEEDQLEEGEGETLKIIDNEDKKSALAAAAKIGEEIINNRFAGIKALPQRHENYLAELALVEKNTGLVKKAITEIPVEPEYKIEGTDRSYKFKFSDEDFKEAEAMVLGTEIVKNKNLSPEEVKVTAATFMQAKNIKKIIAEVEAVAYKRGVDETEAGKSGIIPDRDSPPGSEDERMKFAKKMGLIP